MIKYWCILFVKVLEEDQAVEEEEAEGEEVEEIKAGLSSRAKRRNLIVTTKTMVSLTSFGASKFGLMARY